MTFHKADSCLSSENELKLVVNPGGPPELEAEASWASLIAGRASSESLVSQSFQSTFDNACVTWDVDGTENGMSDVKVDAKALADGGCFIILLDDEDDDEEEDLDVKKENGLMLAPDTVKWSHFSDITTRKE